MILLRLYVSINLLHFAMLLKWKQSHIIHLKLFESLFLKRRLKGLKGLNRFIVII